MSFLQQLLPGFSCNSMKQGHCKNVIKYITYRHRHHNPLKTRPLGNNTSPLQGSLGWCCLGEWSPCGLWIIHNTVNTLCTQHAELLTVEAVVHIVSYWVSKRDLCQFLTSWKQAFSRMPFRHGSNTGIHVIVAIMWFDVFVTKIFPNNDFGSHLLRDATDVDELRQNAKNALNAVSGAGL
jgi:hypothetical protein